MSNQTRTDKIYLEGRGYTNLTILTLSFCFICLPSLYLTINKIKFYSLYFCGIKIEKRTSRHISRRYFGGRGKKEEYLLTIEKKTTSRLYVQQ